MRRQLKRTTLSLTMNSDLVQAQLILLCSKQPDRLSSRALTPAIFSKPYDNIFLAMRDAYLSNVEPTLGAIAMTPGLSEEALVCIERLRGYGEPEISMEHAINFLTDAKQRKEFSSIVQTAYNEGHDRSIPIGATINSLLASAVGLTRNDASHMHHGGDLKDVELAIEWRARNPGVLRGPSTGFMRLDRRVNGFIPRFTLIGARASAGKSALIGNFIEAECEVGNHALLFAAEMAAPEYQERILSQVSGVNISSHRTTPFSDIEMKALIKAQRAIKKWKWWINDNPDITIDEIEATTTAHVNMYGRVHVMIDYLQLVGVKSKASRYEQVGEISSRLKKMQRRLKIPVTAAAQLRRQESYFDRELKRTVNPDPRLEDLRESGNLEQDADMVLLLGRDILNDPENAKLIIAKQRGGSTDAGIDLTYHPSTTKFKELVK